MRSLILAAIIILSYQSLFSQFILNDWKAYTSYSNTNKAVTDLNGDLWVCTSGGVYKYSADDDTYITFNNLNGLSSINATAITSHTSENSIFVGYEEGYIDIINDDLSIINVLDIASSGFTSAKINDMLFVNGKLLVGGNFGLTELVPDLNGSFLDQVFQDTYRNTIINDIYYKDGKIWISSDKGIAYIDENITISDPSNWTYLYDDNGLRNTNYSGVSIYVDSIYVFFEKDLYSASLDSLQFTQILENDYNINSFIMIEDHLHISFNWGVRDLINNSAAYYWDSPSNNAIQFNGQTVYLTEGLGAVYLSDGNSNYINPPSPATNQVADLLVDDNSNLWVATNSRGFLKFDGNNWLTFNGGNNSEYPIPQNSFHTLAKGNNGEIYIGHQGSGLTILNENNNEYEIEVFDNTNAPFIGADAETGGFVVVGEMEEDPNGVLWSVNWADIYPGPVLVAKDGDAFYAFNYSNQSQRDYFNIAIDNAGTIWMGSERGRNSNGLLLFNHGGTLDNTSDDKFLQIKESSSSRLVDNTINAIEVDKNGWIWCGTPNGVTYFITPDLFQFYDDVSSLSPISPSLFDDLSVNDIMIDPVNQKWFATNSGIWIYDSDGVELIAKIDTDNSPLPDNNITSLSMNEDTGEIFFGTSKGIYSAKSLSVQSRNDYEISVFPQPFNPIKHDAVIIDGLAEASDVKIITPDGLLIWDAFTQSRKITWNGRDKDGNKVSPGVYLVIATSETKGKSGVGKIAIVRKP